MEWNGCITKQSMEMYGKFWTTLWKWSNWGLGMFRYDQFQVASCWERKKKTLSVFVFPTVNVYLEGDIARSWWKPFIYLDETCQKMEESLRAQRLRWTQNYVLWEAWPPPTECDFQGPHSKISQIGLEFLATALKTITVSGPSTVYHLVLVYPHTRGLHESKNLYPNPKRPLNMLHGTDPDPCFIWKWDPIPVQTREML